MKIRLSRFVVPAVLAATIPAAAVFAQGQNQGQNQPPARSAGPTAETLTRLQDGRIAMIKGALKLNDTQLRLWAPVEEQMRASFTARQQARSERRERHQQGAKTERPSLPDRLDRASKRMTDRAERMKAYAEAIRPFYASLTDDQKAVAGVVLRQGAGFGRHGARWAMHRDRRAEQ
jgi:hypothetical protein